jgi:hypothetical protein
MGKPVDALNLGPNMPLSGCPGPPAETERVANGGRNWQCSDLPSDLTNIEYYIV